MSIQELCLKLVKGNLIKESFDSFLELGWGTVHEDFLDLSGDRELSCRVSVFVYHEKI